LHKRHVERQREICVTDGSQLKRDDLIAELAHTSHQTWMRQTAHDRGIPIQQLGGVPTDDDRQRATDTVAALERLGLYGAAARPSRLALLRHPLVVGSVIAAISAVFASLLIPNITQVSQDRPKELELKLGLIDKIATSSAQALTRGVALSRGDVAAAGGSPGDKVDSANRKVLGLWRTDAAIVDAKLLTYFPGSNAQLEWPRFKRAIEAFLLLEAVDETDVRRAKARYLRSYLEAFPNRPDPSVPWDRIGLRGEIAHTKAEKLQALLLDKRERIMRSVTQSQADGFKHSPWSFG
jgi:hypothetical protein